jgi:CPA1 family monovalent cation:H+ antiporter
MPRRILTTLHAESLINDGTALVLFSVGLGLIVGGTEPGLLGLTERFVLASTGGVAAGLLVGWAVILLRRRLDDPLREGALSVLTPFVAFLLAELVHASGVLAVVVAGLVLAYAAPRVIRARSRVLAYGFWDLATFLINGGLFVLLGMQIPRALRDVTSLSVMRALVIAVVVTVVVVLTRMVWIHLAAFAFLVVDRRAAEQDERVDWRVRTAAGWAGFRGAVSLAAALAVPVTTPTGTRVHERDLIIFATAVVILLTMLIQGTTLPAVVGWAGLVGDTRRVGELRLARVRATEAALAVLPEVADRLGAAPDAVDRIRADYEQHLDDIRSTDEESRSAEQARDLDRRLRLAVLEHKRREITRLRDTNEIDDIVLRELQAVLDIEEIRLLGPEVNE